MLAATDKAFPEAESRALGLARLGIAQRMAIARGDARSADAFAAESVALVPPTDASDIELRCACRALRSSFAYLLCHTPLLRLMLVG